MQLTAAMIVPVGWQIWHIVPVWINRIPQFRKNYFWWFIFQIGSVKMREEFIDKSTHPEAHSVDVNAIIRFADSKSVCPHAHVGEKRRVHRFNI
jgi:hypothetical protein